MRRHARHFNISRDTVAKALAFSVPPGDRRTAPIKRPKLDAFIAIIDAGLAGDRQAPGKQRHAAKRLFDRLRAEHGFTGGYTIVKEYVGAEAPVSMMSCPRIETLEVTGAMSRSPTIRPPRGW